MGTKSSVFMCQQVISPEISLIFEGLAYFVVRGFQLDNGMTKKFLIEIPGGPQFVHFNSAIITGLGAELRIREAADRNGVTPITCYNANRNKPDVALTYVYEGVSGGTTDGVVIKDYHIGANTGNPLVDGGGTADQSPKVVLKQNTKYAIEIASQGNGNNITLILYWFEFDTRAA